MTVEDNPLETLLRGPSGLGGNVDGLVERREALVDALAALTKSHSRRSGLPETREVLHLRLLCARAFALTREVARLGVVLEPYLVGVATDADAVPDRSAIERVRDCGDRVIGGMFLTQLTAFVYERGNLDDAAWIGSQANALLDRAEVGGAYAKLYSKAELAVCRGRVEWRKKHREEAEKILNTSLENLSDRYAKVSEGDEEGGHVVVAIAQTLKLLAAIDWVHNSHEHARLRVLRAIVMLHARSVRDSIHLAQGYYLAAKIAATESRHNFVWAEILAHRGAQIFDGDVYRLLGNRAHPWRARLTVQQCQTKVKAFRERQRNLAEPDRPGAYEEEYEDIQLLLSEARNQARAISDDKREQERTLAELDLTTVWLHQSRAELEDLPSRWDEVAQGASKIVARTPIPTRVWIEARLAQGRASIRCGRVAEGRALVQQALRAAREAGRRKAEVGCLLSLAEADEGASPASTKQAWAHAKELLSHGVKSTYLERWAEDMRTSVEGGHTWVDLRGHYSKAFRPAVDKAWMEFQLSLGRSKEELYKEMGGNRQKRVDLAKPMPDQGADGATDILDGGVVGKDAEGGVESQEPVGALTEEDVLK